MSIKLARILIPSGIIFALAGIAATKLQRYKRSNQIVQQLTETGKLEEYLHELHQNMAFRVDQTLEQYENNTKIPQYRKVLLEYCEGSVLETCVGTSRNLKYYKPGTAVTLIDWSTNMIEFALSKNSPFVSTDYKVADVTKMPFEDSSFDTVVDTFGLEYVLNPEKALDQMRRVCKKNGRILLLAHGVPSLLESHWLYKLKNGDQLMRGGYFNNRDWQKMVKSKGFQIDRLERKVDGTIYFIVMTNNK